MEGRASRFAVAEASAHQYMAEVCLVYLMHFGKDNSLYQGIISDFPILSYAHYWYQRCQVLS